ncbi:MAG: GAF domain-containing protein, partial [Deltaproteobacteria bacterium]|nr:GAF domain-containing protein [Deltaproteobacteria bacterium]
MQKGNNTPSLTKKEIEILKWVQEGKTNEEIGLILGRTKWTVKFHLTNVMKKLDVASRTQAVSHAIAYGILPALRPIGTGEKGVGKLRIGLIGCGNGGSAMMELLKDNPVVELVWVADSNRKAPGLKIAKKLNVETSTDYVSMLKKKVDVVVNVTGSREISEELRQSVPTDVEIMGGVSAKIMVELFEERRKRMEERQKMLKEHEALYHLGLVIESIDSVNDAGYAIIDYATKLTNTPAGSLALFDEKNEDMVLVAAKGFSKQFKNIDRWEIRPGGLTSKILNQDGPMLIPDLTDHEEQNPVLLREGVKSILAAPLTVEGRIIGILYVNDFKPKNFRVEDISLFSLLTVYAGLTI